MYICICNRVTDTEIQQAAADGIRDFATLKAELKVASCCGKCENCARKVLSEAVASEVEVPFGDLVPAMAMGTSA